MPIPPDPNEPPDAPAAWRRVRAALRRLFEALADLDEAGGLDAADVHAWPPRRRARAIGLLRLVRNMIDHVIRQARN